MASLVDHIREYGDFHREQELRALLADTPVFALAEAWDELADDEATRIFRLLGLEAKAQLLSELEPREQEHIIRGLQLENMRGLLQEMDPDDLVDLIQQLSPSVRQAVWDGLDEHTRQSTLFLLRFDSDDAAGLMTPRYVALRPNITVSQALTMVRQTAKSTETIYYLYVVDELKRVMGVLSLRDLMVAEDGMAIRDIMRHEVVTVLEDTDQEEVARILEAWDLIALPVVDRHNRLLGIITFDDVIDIIRSEQTEDLYKMGAMEGSDDAYTASSVFKLFRKRVPWLIVLLLAGTLTTNLLNFFEPVFLSAAFLVWFVPVITQTGGNSGTQSSTLMIRGIAMGQIDFGDLGKVMLKELAVGLLLGLILGAVIMLRGVFLPPGIGIYPALVIGVSLVFVVLFSSIIGAFAPLVIHRLGFDPTVMAGPLMATVIDVVGLTIYFRTAGILLQL